MSVFLLSMTILNLILWVIFIIRFKKLFSTDSIIEKTKNQMNKIIKDIDAATERDVFLSKEATARIQNVISDAEQKMEIFNQASQRLRDMIAEADKINKNSNKKSIYKDLGSIPKVETKSYNTTSNINAYLKNKSETLSSTQDLVQKEKSNVSVQKDLFDNPDVNNQIEKEDVSEKESPLIITNIVQEGEDEVSFDKTDLTENVKYLFNQGFDVKEIASKLSCSIIQVQFIIDML